MVFFKRSLQHHRDHFGIRRGRKAHPALEQFLAQGRGVDQVAVVGNGQRAVSRFDQEWLGVAGRGRAGGGIAGVPDGVVSLQWGQVLRGKHLRDQAHVFVQAQGMPVRDRDAAGLLAAVLQGEHAKEGHPRYVFLRGKNADDAALLVRAVAVEVLRPRLPGWCDITRARCVLVRLHSGVLLGHPG
jgi:hypothetical protein